MAPVPIPTTKETIRPQSTPKVVISNINVSNNAVNSSVVTASSIKYNTVVVKSELGIGLDLAKCPQTGRARVAKFKEFPGMVFS